MRGVTATATATRKNSNNNNSSAVSLWAKLTAGLDSKPRTDFERMLARFGELNKIRGRRELTKEERRKHLMMANHIDNQFQTMFKRFDEKMVGRRQQQRQQQQQQQKGGAETADAAPPEKNENILMNVWDWIKQQYDALMQSIKNTAEENQRKALENVTPEKMMKLLGVDANGNPNAVSDKLGQFDEKIQNALKSIQKTVTNGIANAAGASVEALFNVLSAAPVIGTPILMWRIFQNLLVIVGAAVSVQSTNVSIGRDVLSAIDAAKTSPDASKREEEDREKRDAKAAEEAAANEAEEAKKTGKKEGTGDNATGAGGETGDGAEAGAGAGTGAGAEQTTKEEDVKNKEGATGAGAEQPTKKEVKTKEGDKAKTDVAGGGMRKTKKNTPNRPRKYGTVAAYAREIHRSLKRFHSLGAPNINHKYPPSHYPYALKLSSAAAAGFKPVLKPVAAN